MLICSRPDCSEPVEKSGYCPSCRRAVYKKWVAEHPGYETARKKAWYARNPEKRKARALRKHMKRRVRLGCKSEYKPRVTHTPEERAALRFAKSQRREARRDPIKKAARTAVKNAIRAGLLARGACEKCGEPDAHGHHPDYGKPLKIIWLCHRRHMIEHGLMKLGLFD